MYSRSGSSHRVRGLVFLLVALVALGGLPTRQATAAPIEQAVDDSLVSFSDGIFLRSALNSVQRTDPPGLGDDVGAVQLGRSGVLKPWLALTQVLPEALAGAGMVALGKRLFVVGGTTSGEGRSNRVYWTEVNPDNGVPTVPNGTEEQYWRQSTVLPSVIHNPDSGCDTPESQLSDAAVVGVSTGGNTGYIYVIGGNVRCGSTNVSSMVVHIGKVDANGDIVWSRGPDIPPLSGSFKDGLQLASAVAITTSANRTFVYLLGGQRRYLDPDTPGAPLEDGSKKVFYAEVNMGSGALGAWTAAPDIPLPVTSEGMWRATAVGGRFDLGGQDPAVDQAIYIMGGQQKKLPAADAFTTALYRANIANDGALTWTTTPGANNSKPVALPETRVDMAGVAFNGKLYMTGGRQGTQVSPSGFRDNALTVFVKDNLSLPETSPGNSQFFVVSPLVLQAARARHMMAVVPATPKPGEESAAWVYVAGGIDKDNQQSTNTLYYGRIGGVDESNDSTLAPDGWYYSSPVNVQVAGADTQVLELRWFTTINRSAGTDIKMEYRTAIAADGNCAAPNVFPDTWVSMDGSQDAFFSQDGRNAAAFPPNLRASCIQYRAYLTTNNDTVSPVLLRVSLLKLIPGNPDLKPYELAAQLMPRGSLDRLKVTIENNNQIPEDQPTRPADFSLAGDFFVDLCISAPNGTLEIPPPPQEGVDPACTTAYAKIKKSIMGVGTIYTIPDDVWYDAKTDQITPLQQYFSEAATYQVFLIVDSVNYVDEGTHGAENNNVSQMLTFTTTDKTIVDTKRYVRIPLLRR